MAPFPRLSQALEAGGIAARRPQLLAGLVGQVIDVGVGTGASFPHYPPAVGLVLAIEPEPHLRRIAAAAARTAPVPVNVADGVAGRLARRISALLAAGPPGPPARPPR